MFIVRVMQRNLKWSYSDTRLTFKHQQTVISLVGADLFFLFSLTWCLNGAHSINFYIHPINLLL